MRGLGKRGAVGETLDIQVGYAPASPSVYRQNYKLVRFRSAQIGLIARYVAGGCSLLAHRELVLGTGRPRPVLAGLDRLKTAHTSFHHHRYQTRPSSGGLAFALFYATASVYSRSPSLRGPYHPVEM